MAVRAKMRCTARREFTQGAHSAELSGVTVTLQAVYGAGPDDKANEQWSKWTPSGQLEMSITNPEAFKQFEIGKSYYVDLVPAEI